MEGGKDGGRRRLSEGGREGGRGVREGREGGEGMEGGDGGRRGREGGRGGWEAREGRDFLDTIALKIIFSQQHFLNYNLISASKNRNKGKRKVKTSLLSSFYAKTLIDFNTKTHHHVE